MADEGTQGAILTGETAILWPLIGGFYPLKQQSRETENVSTLQRFGHLLDDRWLTPRTGEAGSPQLGTA